MPGGREASEFGRIRADGVDDRACIAAFPRHPRADGARAFPRHLPSPAAAPPIRKTAPARAAPARLTNARSHGTLYLYVPVAQMDRAAVS